MRLSAIASLAVYSLAPLQTHSFGLSRHPAQTQRERLSFHHDFVGFYPRTPMKMTSVDDSTTDDNERDSKEIRYLGSGEDAIVRPGVVLLAPNHEYDHFLRRSAVFVYAIGLDESENTIIRGVVLDHPTAFSIGEMSPNVVGALSDNVLFRGGYDGNDSAMMLHSAGGPDGPIQSESMIGMSGMYEGGIVSAMEAANAGKIEPGRCKFFFSHMEFTEKELDNMFAGSDEGDMWMSLEIPTEYVLDSNYSRGQLWSKLRNKSREFRNN